MQQRLELMWHLCLSLLHCSCFVWSQLAQVLHAWLDVLSLH
jgi:hypothetical protein